MNQKIELFNNITLRKTEIENENSNEEMKLNYFGTRHIQSFLVFWGVAIAFAIRVNLSVAIVSMTDTTETFYEIFDWDQQKSSLILSAFFWGYLVNQIPGGQLSKKYGAKYTLIFAVFSSSILTLITPILTLHFDWQALMILRFFEGVVQGFTFPSVHTFLSKWSPVHERARLSVFIYSGMILGTFLMMITSGLIASNYGWPNIFYVSGSIGLLWVLIWQIFGASTPAEHPSISENERMFIQKSLGHTEDSHKEYIPTPWLKIFKSLPFYALLIGQCCHVFGFTMLLTESPTYFHGVFWTNIEENAVLASLPYLGRFIMEYIFIGIEFLLSKRNLNKISISRKAFNSFGQFMPAIGFIVIGFIPNGYLELAVITLIISMAFNGATGLGILINHIDLASNHAGTLFGICNFFSGIFGICAPIIVGWIVVDVHDQEQWQIIFAITSTFLIFGGLIFLIFGSTKTQEWNEIKKLDTKV